MCGNGYEIEPIDRCISALKAERHYDEVIFTTPDGEQFNQKMANTLSMSENLIILCGHFKGIDYRIRRTFHYEGNQYRRYVLTGGELAAAVISDAIVRIIPGVISDEQSALSDSFQDNLLAPPVYTVRLNTMVGKFLMSFCLGMRLRFVNGNFSSHWSVHSV